MGAKEPGREMCQVRGQQDNTTVPGAQGSQDDACGPAESKEIIPKGCTFCCPKEREGVYLLSSIPPVFLFLSNAGDQIQGFNGEKSSLLPC